MTAPTSNRFDTIGSAGASTGASGLVPVVTIRSPSSSDITGPNGPYRIGQSWINSAANSSYTLTSLTSSAGLVTANWEAAGATSTLATLTASSGGALTPTAGNISILGTANQVTTAGSGSTITLTTPAAFIAPGSIAATTTLTATLGNITATNGNVSLGTAGNKLLIATGANASAGKSAAMTGGTITISTTAVTASSLIFLTNAGAAGTVGTLSVGTITAGTSFVITSSSGTDTSVVNWLIIN